MHVPLSVPEALRAAYLGNLKLITKNTGHLLLFACDQKIEHLNKDFYGPNLPDELADPAYVFNLAANAPIGAFATHIGMVARHAGRFPDIPYLIKVNGKTDLIKNSERDPLAAQLASIEDVMLFKKASGLNIVGVGMTVYLGSEDEAAMLSQASRLVLGAHANGLICVLWMYPRGKAVIDEKDPMILAGAAGVAHSLGADFVKIPQPQTFSADFVKMITRAAGNTGVIFSGGSKQTSDKFFADLALCMGNGAAGAAIGRNIFQRPYEEALSFAQQAADLIYLK